MLDRAPLACAAFLTGLACGAAFIDHRAALACAAGAYGCFLLAWLERRHERENRAARYVLAHSNRLDGLTILDLERACELLDLAVGPGELLTVDQFLAEVLAGK